MSTSIVLTFTVNLYLNRVNFHICSSKFHFNDGQQHTHCDLEFVGPMVLNSSNKPTTTMLFNNLATKAATVGTQRLEQVTTTIAART